MTRIVTSPADNGDNTNPPPGSLRAALISARSGDTITFDPNIFPSSSPVAISLVTTLPVLSQGNLTIDATGQGVILDGAAIDPARTGQCLTGALANPIGLCIRSSNNIIRGLQILHFAGDGIRLSAGAHNNILGGDSALGQGNTISANGENGVTLLDAGTTSNLIQGNWLGADVTGIQPLGNQSNGISLLNGAANNTLGPGNWIANNENGIHIDGSTTTGNTITQNTITANREKGILLTAGGNRALTPPVITGLTGGILAGTAPDNTIVEIFTDPFFEGLTVLGTAIADANGAWRLAVSVPGPLFTATARDTAGNTSEFAAYCSAAGIATRLWPFCGTFPSALSSAFGPRQHAAENDAYEWHIGVDLPAPSGTPVYAIADGIVKIAGTDPNYGSTVIQIRHTDAGVYYSNYLHVLLPTVVTVNQAVVKGQLLGYSGASSSGFEHLHLEIRAGGSLQSYAVNPFRYLPYPDTSSQTATILAADTSSAITPYVVLKVTSPPQELDFNRATVSLYQNNVNVNSQYLDYNELTAEGLASLSDPYQAGVCIQPAPFTDDGRPYEVSFTFENLVAANGEDRITGVANDLTGHAVSTDWSASRNPVRFSPRDATQTVHAGSTVTFTHRLQSQSTVTQTLNLSALSAQGWAYSVQPTSVTLAPGASITVTLSASIPSDPSAGHANCLTLLATPSDSPVARAVAVDRTTTANSSPTVGAFSADPPTATVSQAVSYHTTFNDLDGWQDITRVTFTLNWTYTTTRGLFAQYEATTGQLGLANDVGQLTQFCTPGQPGVLANSFVLLDCGITTVSGSGTALTIDWYATPLAAFGGRTGSYTAFVTAQDASGATTSGSAGTWTLLDQRPNTGSCSYSAPLPWAANQPVVVTASASDPEGFLSLRWLDTLVHPTLVFQNDFAARYDHSANRLLLLGAGRSCAPGQGAILTNSVVQVDCRTTTVTGFGGSLTVAWHITPLVPFTADNLCWQRVMDTGGLVDGWHPMP